MVIHLNSVIMKYFKTDLIAIEDAVGERPLLACKTPFSPFICKEKLQC